MAKLITDIEANDFLSSPNPTAPINSGESPTATDVQRTAAEMIEAGFSPIPVPFGEKGPRLNGWQKLRITREMVPVYFTEAPSNIGLLLGAASDDLVDVDLDAAEAVAAADHFLPHTQREHGRASRPRSHRWYIASPAPRTTQFEDPDGSMLVELRSTGAQTIIPPSVHETRERLAWDAHGAPAHVDPTTLAVAVARLAACAMVARRWKPGQRHFSSLALAGMLLRGGWSEDDTLAFAKAITTSANDEEAEARFRNVADTAERLRANEPVTGAKQLAELLPDGEKVVRKLRKWLHLETGLMIAPPAATTRPTTGASGASTAPNVIDVDDGDLAGATAEVWKAIAAANTPEQFFRYGGRPARIETDDLDVPTVKGLTVDRMRYHIARIATFTGKKRKRVNPPVDLVRDVLATPNIPLPVLRTIVQVPVLAPDGSIHNTVGYSAATQAYFMAPPGLAVPHIPDAPTTDDVARARSLILDELLHDFPFVDEAERAMTVGLVILPFVRRLISGPTPLHLIEKPAPGTGGSLLASMITELATARPAAVMTEARNEDEWRKRITAKLVEGPAVVFIDNLRNRVDSASLSAVITTSVWEDRPMGLSEIWRMPVECVWVATGNNPTLSTEMARRTVRIRMDAKQEQPWRRETTAFRHPDLPDWVRTNRSDLVWAILVLGRAWVAAGRPAGTQTLGMFESWAKVVGGILNQAGIPGFLGNLQDFYDTADTETIAFRNFVHDWWRNFSNVAVPAAALLIVADGLDLGSGSESSQRTALGLILRKLRDRRFDVFQVTVCGKQHNANLWKLVADPCPTCGDRELWTRETADQGWACKCSTPKQVDDGGEAAVRGGWGG